MLYHQKYRSILCLNGELPNENFFRSRGLPIIAADGAANQLVQSNIMPDMIIGDLDSVNKAILKNCASIYAPNQDSSDYQKCLAYLESQQLLPAIVVGLQGGYLDHILNNINIFLQTNSLCYAPPLLGFTLQKGNHSVVVKEKNTKISLFGLPQAIVSAQALKWPLHRELLTFPGHNACLNRSKQDTVQITVHKGQLLVLVYQNIIVDAGAS